MSINILPEDEITLTRSEHQKYMREWQQFCSCCVDPPDFETYVRSRITSESKFLPVTKELLQE